MLIKLSAYSLAAFALAGSVAAHAQTARWKVEQAVANGTGCIMGGDTIAIAAGDQIQFIFSNLGVDLPANSGLPFAGRKVCTLAVPAQIHGDTTQLICSKACITGALRAVELQQALPLRERFLGFP